MEMEDPKTSFESSLVVNFGHKPELKLIRIIFTALYNYIPQSTFNDFYSYMLLVWSFLQLSGLTTVTENAPDSLLNSVNYTRIYTIIEFSKQKYVYYAVLFLTSAFIAIYSFFIFLSMIFRKGWGIAYVSLFLPILFWIGVAPITELYLGFFYCKNGIHYIVDDLECSGAFYYILMAGVAVMILLWICVLSAVTFVSSYSHPYSGNHFAHFPWNFEAIYTLIRILLILEDFFLKNYELVHEYIQWVSTLFICAYLLSHIIDVFPYYNPVISWLFGCSIMAFFVTGLSSFIARIVSIFFVLNTNSRCILYIASILVCIPMSLTLQETLIRRLMANPKVESAKEIDMQIYYFLSTFVTKKHPDRIAEVFMDGYLQYFKQSCVDQKCPLFSSELLDVERVFYDDSCEESKKITDKNGKLRHLAAYLLESMNKKERLNITLCMQLARMYAYVLGNIHNACLEILNTEELEPGLTIRFSLFCFKQDLIKYLKRKHLAQQKKGRGSFYNVLIHEKLFNEFVEFLGTITRIKMKFWTELTHNRDLNALRKLGYEIVVQSRRISAIWQQLNEIYPYHRPSLILYMNYLYNVDGFYDEAAKAEQALNKEQWQKSDAKDLSDPIIFSNESTSIIMGGESYNLGKILSATSTIEELLGYAPKTLINKDVSILMPLLIRRKHTEFLKEYFRTGKRYKDDSIPTFAVHKDGYVVPVKVAHQQIFSLRLGIIYVGNVTINSAEISNDFILTDEEGKIYGMSKKLEKIFQASSSLLLEQQWHIQDFCPQLAENYSDIEGIQNVAFCFEGVTKGALKKKDYSKRSRRRESLRQDNLMKLQSIKKCQVIDYNYPRVKFTFKAIMTFPVKLAKMSTLEFHRARKSALNFEILPILKLKMNAPVSRAKLRIIEEVAETQNPALQKIEEEKLPKDEKSTTSTKQLLTDLSKNQTTEKLSHSENEEMPMRENVPEVKVRPKKTSKGIATISDMSKSALLNLANVSISASSKANKGCAMLNSIRNQPYSNFNPVPITRLKYVIYLFMLLLFCGILGRLVISLIFGNEFKGFGDLVIRNARRFTTMGNIAKMMTIMLHYNENTTLDIQFRDNYFNYSLLLGEFNSEHNTYATYITEQIKQNTQYMHEDGRKISNHISGFKPDNIKKINPKSLLIFYKGNSMVPYSCGIECVITSILDNTLVILGKIKNSSKYINKDDFNEFFILNTTYGGVINVIDSAYEGIHEEYMYIQSRHNKISTSLTIVIVVILTCLVLVLFLFLTVLNREQSSMLMLLVKIKKRRIMKQISNEMKFLRSILNSNIEMSEEEFFKDKDQDSSVLENEDIKDLKQEKPKVESREQFTPYRSAKWCIIIVAVFFSGAILLTHVLFFYLASLMCDSSVHHIKELQSLAYNSYFYSYILAFLYSYISSNKEAYCGYNKCKDIFPIIIREAKEELGSLLIQHKKYSSVMSQGYLNSFQLIMEGNPCNTVKEFKEIEACSTFLGGVFTDGAYAASKSFLELALAVYMDFDMKGTEDEIDLYLNDKRLLQMEILTNLLLNSAYSILATELMDGKKRMLDHNESESILMFVIFGIFLLTITIIGETCLIQHLRKSLYETRIMICSLPPDIILTNDDILRYLSDKLIITKL